MRYHTRTAPVPLVGEVRVPGDKSISHRAVLFAAMAQGTSRLTGVLDSADVRSTMSAVESLGALVEVVAEGDTGLELVVRGWGTDGPIEPLGPIDCGNSGTTVRLLLGVLAGWDVHAVLTGDESLSTRPMRRVTSPLAAMGARVRDRRGRRAAVGVNGGGLVGGEHDLAVASAQVKSAILLAGVRAQGVTRVCETRSQSRPHERMLPAFGVPVAREGLCASVSGPVASSRPTSRTRRSLLGGVSRGAALLVPGERRHVARNLAQPHAHRLPACAREDGRRASM